MRKWTYMTDLWQPQLRPDSGITEGVGVNHLVLLFPPIVIVLVYFSISTGLHEHTAPFPRWRTGDHNFPLPSSGRHYGTIKTLRTVCMYAKLGMMHCVWCLRNIVLTSNYLVIQCWCHLGRSYTRQGRIIGFVYRIVHVCGSYHNFTGCEWTREGGSFCHANSSANYFKLGSTQWTWSSPSAQQSRAETKNCSRISMKTLELDPPVTVSESYINVFKHIYRWNRI